jgi:hypothetical protein
MESGWHAVTLIPVYLPATAHGVSRPEFKTNSCRGSLSVCCRYVSDVIANIHVLNVVGILGLNVSQTGFTTIIVVNIVATVLSFNFWTNIFYSKVFIDSNIAPMRNTDFASGLSQNHKGCLVLKMNRNNIEAKRFYFFRY